MASRKTRSFLDSFVAVNKTDDEVVKNMFRPGKFACTITGCLQLVGIISLLTNVLIVGISNYCRYHVTNRILNLGTASVTVLNGTVLYLIFCFGYVVHNPSFWVRINIISNLILSIVSIIAQTMAMNSCRTLEFVHNSPGPLAIVGGSCLLLSCCSLFLLYRYKELDVEIKEIVRKQSEDRTGRNVVVVVPPRKYSPATRSEGGSRKVSLIGPAHIKGQLYVKHDDVKRKCSRCQYEGTQSPKRKISVYSQETVPQLPALHQSANNCYQQGTAVSHIKRKMSADCSNIGLGRGHENFYPQCSKSRRKTFAFSEC